MFIKLHSVLHNGKLVIVNSDNINYFYQTIDGKETLISFIGREKALTVSESIGDILNQINRGRI